MNGYNDEKHQYQQSAFNGHEMSEGRSYTNLMRDIFMIINIISELLVYLIKPLDVRQWLVIGKD